MAGAPFWLRHRESDRIAGPLQRRPRATAGVAQIAECFNDILGRSLVFVPRSGAVPRPTATQRQSRRMRPLAVL